MPPRKKKSDGLYFDWITKTLSKCRYCPGLKPLRNRGTKNSNWLYFTLKNNGATLLQCGGSIQQPLNHTYEVTSGLVAQMVQFSCLAIPKLCIHKTDLSSSINPEWEQGLSYETGFFLKSLVTQLTGQSWRQSLFSKYACQQLEKHGMFLGLTYYHLA